MSQIVKLRRLPHGEGLDLPAYATPGASGFDLSAAISDKVNCSLRPGERALIPTGFAFEVPPGHEMQVRPRSGHALKAGVMVVNSPGTVDSDFRGEVQVILYNSGNQPFIITRGMRIAQGVIAPTIRAEFVLADELSDTERGAGGYGSTGSTPLDRFKALVTDRDGNPVPATMTEALAVAQASQPERPALLPRPRAGMPGWVEFRSPEGGDVMLVRAGAVLRVCPLGVDRRAILIQADCTGPDDMIRGNCTVAEAAQAIAEALEAERRWVQGDGGAGFVAQTEEMMELVKRHLERQAVVSVAAPNLPGLERAMAMMDRAMGEQAQRLNDLLVANNREVERRREAERRMRAVRLVMVGAARQFDSYAAQHAAKCTLEADAKAATNVDYRDQMRAAVEMIDGDVLVGKP